MTDVFHKAARDGYIDLLKEATRRDCDRGDEDGMTPTMWAAYYGNLDALRMIVGRGGNPDKFDHLGSTAMHHGAANGHMNCVSFLISFGANIWSLDNDFHTPLDVAALNNHDQIVSYLDSVINKQMTLNKRVVKKLKEKSVLDAQKRIKKYRKLQQKARKRADKTDERTASEMDGRGMLHSAPSSIYASVKHDKKKFSTVTSLSSVKSIKSSVSEPKPYSAHLNMMNKKKFQLTGVAKKLKHKTVKLHGLQSNNVNQNADFKVGEIENDGKRTVRSLSGLKRDYHVMYVKPGGSISSGSFINGDLDSMSVGNGKDYDVISRAISEPDFFYSESGIDNGESPENAGIFERPGFGSVAFMNRRTTGALMSLPNQDEQESIENQPVENGHSSTSDTQKRVDKKQRQRRGSLSDSIGTVSSLTARMKDIPWTAEDIDRLDDDEEESSPIELFLAAHGLADWYVVFSKEKVDLEAMMLLNDLDLKVLGLPMGPRRKIMDAVARRKQVLNNPGALIDTHL